MNSTSLTGYLPPPPNRILVVLAWIVLVLAALLGVQRLHHAPVVAHWIHGGTR